jgi:hypothetical protein
MNTNRGIADFLEQIKDPALELVKNEFLAFLGEAKKDAYAIVKENAQNVEDWGVALATGELTERGFKLLVDEQKGSLAQFLNTVQIEQKARLERITIGLLNILTEKLLGALLALVPK